MLQVERAAKLYGEKLIFKEITFALQPGQVLLLAGPNGAGKSTLMKLIAGLSRPSAGEIRRDYNEDKTGYLGHATFVYPGFTGLENLRFWAKLCDCPRSDEHLMTALDRMALAKAAHERAGSYSRGMSQRLNLARLLLLEPELLLLDEPATGLDQRSLEMLHREIDSARQRGAGVVWISHDVSRDLARADLLLRIDERRMAYFGPASDPTAQAMAGATA